LDPVGRRDARIKWQIAQPAAKLCFADSTVAEEQNLDLRVDPLSGLKVLVVSVDFIQDVFISVFAADLRGQIFELAGK
jgi:hypothetical protein